MNAATIAEQAAVAFCAGQQSGFIRDEYRAHERKRAQQFKMKRRAITCLERRKRNNNHGVEK